MVARTAHAPTALPGPHPPSSVADPPPPQIYTLSLHDALPISPRHPRFPAPHTPSTARPGSTRFRATPPGRVARRGNTDRKSTRLNSSHLGISYAVFCLKKKNQHDNPTPYRRTRRDDRVAALQP